jgi:hypothetical protein
MSNLINRLLAKEALETEKGFGVIKKLIINFKMNLNGY